jgi:hypothetical protein
MPSHIALKAADLVLNAEVMQVGSSESHSTGKPLQQIRVEFTVGSERERLSVQDFMSTSAPVEFTINGQPKQWRIGKNSTSFTVGQQSTHFVWELLEVENLILAALVLDGLEFNPEKYKEQFDSNEIMTASCIVELSQDEEERLHALPKYFEVIRKGINENPRSMRFGQLLWAKKREKSRIQLFLVDKAYDEQKNGHGLDEPRSTNVAKSAALSASRFSALIALLVGKGVLSAEEAERIPNR